MSANDRSRKYAKEHPDRIKAAGSRYYQSHKAKIQKLDHERNHGEPYENKIKRLEEQGFRCANTGCRTTDPGKIGWHTDHDHNTGKVRGELCSGCNRALGYLKDDKFRAEGLAQYLRSHELN